MAVLEREGELRRVKVEADPELEIAAIATRLVREGGPALLFRAAQGLAVPAAHQPASHRAPHRARPWPPPQGGGGGADRTRGAAESALAEGALALARAAVEAGAGLAPEGRALRPRAGGRRGARLARPPRHQVLAGRRGALPHSAAGADAESGDGPEQSRHLPDAGLRARRGGDALADPEGRRLPLRRGRSPGPPAGSGGHLGRRSGALHLGGAAAAGEHGRAALRHHPARRADADGPRQDARHARARQRRVRARRRRRTQPPAHGRPLRRPLRPLLPRRRIPRVQD